VVFIPEVGADVAGSTSEVRSLRMSRSAAVFRHCR